MATKPPKIRKKVPIWKRNLPGWIPLLLDFIIRLLDDRFVSGVNTMIDKHLGSLIGLAATFLVKWLWVISIIYLAITYIAIPLYGYLDLKKQTLFKKWKLTPGRYIVAVYLGLLILIIIVAFVVAGIEKGKTSVPLSSLTPEIIPTETVTVEIPTATDMPISTDIPTDTPMPTLTLTPTPDPAFAYRGFDEGCILSDGTENSWHKLLNTLGKVSENCLEIPTRFGIFARNGNLSIWPDYTSDEEQPLQAKAFYGIYTSVPPRVRITFTVHMPNRFENGEEKQLWGGQILIGLLEDGYFNLFSSFRMTGWRRSIWHEPNERDEIVWRILHGGDKQLGSDHSGFISEDLKVTFILDDGLVTVKFGDDEVVTEEYLNYKRPQFYIAYTTLSDAPERFTKIEISINDITFEEIGDESTP